MKSNELPNIKECYPMQEMPLSERPYEKCEAYGTKNLSDAELLAVIIRTGSRGESAAALARRLLCQLPGKSIMGLFQVSLEQLQEIHGIGRVKAIQLKCMAEFSTRMMQCRQNKPELVCSDPEDIAAFVMGEMRFLETEQVRLLILNGKNVMTHQEIVSNGSFNASLAAPREIFYYALKYKAVQIIVIHNHPSGDPVPSKDDILLTARLADTGKMIGIPLLDHIIIGDNRFFSLKQEGYLS